MALLESASEVIECPSTDTPNLNQLLAEIRALHEELSELQEAREQDRQEIQDLRVLVDRQKTIIDVYIDPAYDMIDDPDGVLHLKRALKAKRERESLQHLELEDIIEKSRKKELTAKEKERLEQIERICRSSPGGYISLSVLKGKLHIGNAQLSRLLRKIDWEKFILRRMNPKDKRERYLCLLSINGVR